MSERSPIDERLPVWTALSELFLDTELSMNDVARIADVLAASPYDDVMLERILTGEVLPVFGGNRVSVAGEWTAWDEDEVRRIMVEASERGYLQRRIAVLFALPVKKAVLAEWDRIRALLERREGPGRRGSAGEP